MSQRNKKQGDNFTKGAWGFLGLLLVPGFMIAFPIQFIILGLIGGGIWLLVILNNKNLMDAREKNRNKWLPRLEEKYAELRKETKAKTLLADGAYLVASEVLRHSDELKKVKSELEMFRTGYSPRGWVLEVFDYNYEHVEKKLVDSHEYHVANLDGIMERIDEILRKKEEERRVQKRAEEYEAKAKEAYLKNKKS
jgi:hypothetical protein